eukprot:TRINITY_DN5913_c1_g1_i1.p1 TRINITY_DN5913_c1_g1~~TRINITY_DN5913_c1_g1_i1.p1  ORF type:complete len:491 (+),score=132.31 TRINITY_DN5913_c1_g1_i1:69-1475(+)
MEQNLDEVWRQYQALYEHLFQSQSYCDGTLVVGRYGRKKVLVHKAILASHSDYFRSLFYGVQDVPSVKAAMDTKDIDDVSDDLCALLAKGGSSSGKDEISVDTEDYTTVVAVLKFVYCGKITLSRGNLIGVKIIADLFQLPLLQEQCIKYLERSLTPDNVCKWLREAEQAGVFTIALTCYEYLRRNVLPVTWSRAWDDLPADTWRRLLQDDETAAAEVELFRGLLQWAEARQKEKGQPEPSPEGLRSVVGELASLVRLPLMPPEDLANVVRPTGLFTEEELSKALMAKFSATPVYPPGSSLTRKRKDDGGRVSGGFHQEFESPSRRSRLAGLSPSSPALASSGGMPVASSSGEMTEEISDAELAMVRASEQASLAEFRRMRKQQRSAGRAELLGVPMHRMADTNDDDDDDDDDEDDDDGALYPSFEKLPQRQKASISRPPTEGALKHEPETSESGEAAEYAQDLEIGE